MTTINLASFRNAIANENLYVDDITSSLLFSAVVTNTPLLLRGPAGTGKTEITKVIAKFLDAEYVFYQCTLGTSEDDLLYRVVPSENTKSGVKLIEGPLPEALRISRNRKVVLVLDEFDKTRPTADALLLDFLQNYRVTVRIGEEREIRGVKDNLTVILTSNDERTFSEPLLRRVVSVEFRSLPPAKVADLLRNRGYDETTVSLLTKLYEDTINARLRKPATIQELYQLAEAIKLLGEEADWTSLVRAYVVKDEDDWKTYVDYLYGRNDGGSDYEDDEYEDYEEYEENYEVDVTEFYEGNYDGSDSVVEERKPKMPKITIEPEARERELETVSMYVEYSEDSYDAVIKTFNPEPSDDPARFGDLKVVKEGDKEYIVKENPLTFKDLFETLTSASKLAKERASVYVKQKVRITKLDIILDTCKVVYYTRDLLRLKYYDGYNVYFDFVLKRVDGDEWLLEGVQEAEHGTTYLVDLVRCLLKAHPAYVASEEFSRELVERYNGRIVNVGKYESSWLSERIVRKTEPYRKFEEKLKQEVRELRERTAKKYGVPEEFVKTTISIFVKARGVKNEEGYEEFEYSIEAIEREVDEETLMREIYREFF